MSALVRSAKLAAYRSVAAHSEVAAADPHALVRMLMDAAIERMLRARSCIERAETVGQAQLLHSCVRLVAELRASLNLKEGGELAVNLSHLYDYVIRRLLLANAASDVHALAEALDLLSEIRRAWVAIGPPAAAIGGAGTVSR